MAEKRPLARGERITAYISDDHSPMDNYVLCPTCGGVIGFNLAELERRRANGQSTSVYCPGDRVGEHYHPSFPPEPIYEFVWAEGAD